jgi:serine/threonine protein kinase
MEVGDRIKGGRWLLDAKLATGGFSVVFAATHRNGSRAAIKVLDSEFTEDEDMRRRFLREGYASNKVGHEGAVRILDDDTTEDGRPYLVMELLEGEALDRRRDRLGGKLPLSEVLMIADELLDVLAAAHSHGIIHRDIKPANVFLTTKGHVKVLDFGFAKVKEAAQGESTAIGTLLGTPGFLPPERARGLGDEVDARSDIWSVGATIFTLVSGAHVHPDAHPIALLAATAKKPVRSLATVAPDVPRSLVDIVDKALAFEKSGRWSSATEMKAALEAVARVEEDSSTIDTGPAKAASKSAGKVRSPLATTKQETDAPLPRLYDEADEGGAKGLTQVLPSAQLQQRGSSNEGQTQILLVPTAAPSAPAVPVATTTPSRHHAAFANTVRALEPPPYQYRAPAPPPRSVWPIVIGSALALLGIILGLVALFGGP